MEPQDNTVTFQVPETLKGNELFSNVDSNTFAQNYADLHTSNSTLKTEHETSQSEYASLKTEHETLQSMHVVPDSYEIAVPEGLTVNDEFMDGFKGMAKEVGYTQEQAAKAAEFYHAKIINDMEAQITTEATWAQSLKDEYKENYDTEINLAKNTLVKLTEKLGDGLVTFLEESRLGSHPEMIKMLNYIGKAISEDSLYSSGQQPSNTPKIGVDGRPLLSFPSMEK